jgi:hypothetical protein
MLICVKIVPVGHVWYRKRSHWRLKEPVKMRRGNIEGKLANARSIGKDKIYNWIFRARVAAADSNCESSRLTPCCPLLQELVKTAIMSFTVKVKRDVHPEFADMVHDVAPATTNLGDGHKGLP